MAGLRRYANSPLVATVLPVVAGVLWYLWHSRVNLCGYNGLKGEPNFPATLALIALVPPVPLITYIRARAEHRSKPQVVGLMVYALVLVLMAIGVAELAFLTDRRCFE